MYVCLVLVYCDHIVYARLGCKKSIHIIHCRTFLLSLTFNSIDDTRLLAHAHKWQMLITCLCLTYNIIYMNWCCGILKIFPFTDYMRQDPDGYLIILWISRFYIDLSRLNTSSSYVIRPGKYLIMQGQLKLSISLRIRLTHVSSLSLSLYFYFLTDIRWIFSFSKRLNISDVNMYWRFIFYRLRLPVFI